MKNVNTCIFEYHKEDGLLWIRIFGAGVHFKDLTKHDLIFSERNGYKKTMRVGKWNIKWLPRVLPYGQSPIKL
jgi:hypothetical protein